MHSLNQQLLGNPNENLESNLEPDEFDELDEFMDCLLYTSPSPRD